MNRHSSDQQPLSPLIYALIALMGFVFTVLSLWLILEYQQRLAASGLANQVFYLLLILPALSAAAFLFGAMRSVAHYTSTQLSTKLEIGGPALMAVLVVVGAYKLVPSSAARSITVRVSDAATGAILRGIGRVIVDLGPDRRERTIDDRGEAVFQGVPDRFLVETLTVTTEAPGYKTSSLKTASRDGVVEIALSSDVTMMDVRGTVPPPLPPGDPIRVLLPDKDAEAVVSPEGRFSLHVRGAVGERVRLQIYQGTAKLYDEVETLPGPFSLSALGPPDK